MIACPSCRTSNTADAQFCGSCGSQLAPGASVGEAYAGFWSRFLAYFIDGVVVAFAGVIGVFIVLVVTGSEALGYAVYFVVLVAYFTWGNASGATLGKKALGIRVVSLASGDEIGLGAALGRLVVWWLGTIPLYLGWFWMVWDKKKQTWHDKAVGSVVVKTRP